MQERVDYSKMINETKLINKVINEDLLGELVIHNITPDDFINHKDVIKFIYDFKSEFGELPSYMTVVSEFDTFEYMPEVPDNINYLCKKVKQNSAKINAYKLIQNDVTKNFKEMDGATFVNWLHAETTRLVDLAKVETSCGTNFATNGAERLDWYMANKEQRTFKYIPTPYASLTTMLGGGWELGDYVLIQAYTNRGKSWIASDIGLASWRNGFGVLHYSPELSKEQQLQRLDTLNGKFKNSSLKSGNLYNEDNYARYLEHFNPDTQTVPYLVKTMDDIKNGVSVDLIEADLQSNPNIKMVIIDGFNLMTHKGNGTNNRDKMSNTSRKLRQLFGKYGVVGLVVHQTPTSAEKENKIIDESGARIPSPPKISDYSETIAVIQDACTVLSFDQLDGVGKITLSKTRTPNVDKSITLHCDFNSGIIREASVEDYF